jgi:hypothetical protein
MRDTKLVSLHWQYVLRLWHKRNQELHGVTKEEQDRKRHQDMINELQKIQKDHQDMPLEQR